MRRNFRLAIVLAALLALTVTAAAAGGLIFRGTVNWNADPQGMEEVSSAAAVPAPTPKPNATGTAVASNEPMPPQEPATMQPVPNDMQLFRLLSEESAKHSGDLIVIAVQDSDPSTTLVRSRVATRGSEQVASLAELEDLLSGSELPMPAALPEGYAVTEIHIVRQCRAEGRYTVISTEEREGCTVTRYQADPAYDAITGYVISLKNDAGAELSIRADLMSATSDMTFGLWDDETARTVSVPGMENALLVEGSIGAELTMRRSLQEPIAVISAHDPLAESPEDHTEVLCDLYISMNGTALNGDVLMDIFGE